MVFVDPRYVLKLFQVKMSSTVPIYGMSMDPRTIDGVSWVQTLRLPDPTQTALFKKPPILNHSTSLHLIPQLFHNLPNSFNHSIITPSLPKFIFPSFFFKPLNSLSSTKIPTRSGVWVSNQEVILWSCKA